MTMIICIHVPERACLAVWNVSAEEEKDPSGWCSSFFFFHSTNSYSIVAVEPSSMYKQFLINTFFIVLFFRRIWVAHCVHTGGESSREYSENTSAYCLRDRDHSLGEQVLPDAHIAYFNKILRWHHIPCEAGRDVKSAFSVAILNAIDIDIPPRVDEKEWIIDETNRIYTSI